MMRLSFVVLLIFASVFAVKTLHREHELHEIDKQFRACSQLPHNHPDCAFYLNEVPHTSQAAGKNRSFEYD